MREAEERGCRTIDGLEMLARQGAAQIEIWTGREPDIRAIKEDLQRALDKAANQPRVWRGRVWEINSRGGSRTAPT